MTADPASARAARRALFLALESRGWTKAEIFAASGQAPDGRFGGNLERFVTR
jgi:hypothetical protein